MIRTGQWTLDVHDVPRLAAFWSAVMGFEVSAGDDGCATLWAAGGEPAVTIWLQRTDADKRGKNRCHPDLVVEGGDVDAEVERVLALGASRADVGQTGAEGFVVLADPEGNEFCILRSDPRSRSRP
jgi:predicted enzyme related to lactoylglutathione lyase